MTLIENAAKWYRMFSVQAMIAIGTINAGVFTLPDHIKESSHAILNGGSLNDVVVTLTIALAILGIVGRLVDQFAPKKDDPA